MHRPPAAREARRAVTDGRQGWESADLTDSADREYLALDLREIGDICGSSTLAEQVRVLGGVREARFGQLDQERSEFWPHLFEV